MHQYPGRYEVDYCGHHGRLSEGNNLFENNPHITPFYEGPPHEIEKHCRDCRYISMSYNYGIQRPHRRHFIEAFHEDLSHKLGHPIEFTEFKADLYLSLEERELWPGLPERYAIIDAGYKRDFIAKYWSAHRFQEVVNATKDRIAWVQIGSNGDVHTPLQNVINLVGQTNLRQLIRVFYRSSLVLTPVSLPMHLAPAVPTVDGKPRPCVVLMGRREQRVWESYSNHTCLGTDGILQCGEPLGGGCWRNKTVKVDNDRSLCRMPMKDEVGADLPECLARISVNDVVKAVELYL
jgi:ADP-heptose:LPS heptosyltransferase